MAADSLQEKVIDYLKDAHAMEQNVLRMLESMISTTSDETMLARLKEHRDQTWHQREKLEDRLEALGAAQSILAEVPAVVGAWFKGMADWTRPDKPGKNARDAFVTEHLEIAAYALLERLAERAGDTETARVAREIRQEEEEMAQWLDSQWDHVVDLTVQEAGVAAIR